MEQRPAILVFGGTGHFGGRIAQRLSRERDLPLIISSRSAEVAKEKVVALREGTRRDDIEAVALDQASPDLVPRLRALRPSVLIHTAGPYQEQDYVVARACIEAGCHYLDLADGRSFVAGIGTLNAAAKSSGITVIAGASTLPAVSSAVVDGLCDRFRRIDCIETSIAPAHRTPRGIGTVRAVLSYCGAPIETWRDRRWQTVYGWQDLRWQRYREIGKRLAGACDVPDLELFPERYPDISSVSFHAALEAPWEQATLWAMAGLTRLGLVRNWARYARSISAVSDRLTDLGSDRGGMQVRVAGTSNDGAPLACTWSLVAGQNHGPEVPCTPAILLAARLARGESLPRGAYPCLGLLSIDDIANGLSDYSITMTTEEEL